jgi:hypothetical protein
MTVNARFFAHAEYASSMIRGKQIAERLECPLNEQFDISNPPKHIVFVKTAPMTEDLKRLLDTNATIWFDCVDSDQALELGVLSDRIKFIAIGETAKRYMQARVMNEVVVIPEHHCNLERCQRKLRPFNTYTFGFIGYKENFCLDIDWVRSELKKINCRFLAGFMTKESTRADVVDFYLQLDAQVVFRVPRIVPNMPPEMKNPLKVINAASFGLATVGYPECSYDEFPLHFAATTPEDLVIQCERLSKTSPFYKTELLQKAEEYHLDNIIPIYEEVLS